MTDKLDQSKSDILHTVNDSLKDLGDGVRELAAAVKDGAPEAWRVMVKQQELDATVNLVSVGAAVLIAMFLYYKTGRYIKTLEGSDRNDWRIGRGIVTTIFILVMILIFNGLQIPEKLINPEYYAAKDLIETMSKARCR